MKTGGACLAARRKSVGFEHLVDVFRLEERLAPITNGMANLLPVPVDCLPSVGPGCADYRKEDADVGEERSRVNSPARKTREEHPKSRQSTTG